MLFVVVVAVVGGIDFRGKWRDQRGTTPKLCPSLVFARVVVFFAERHKIPRKFRQDVSPFVHCFCAALF